MIAELIEMAIVMQQIKVGVIGCGYIAQQVHIPNYIENPKSRLEAICDTNQDTLTKVAKKYGVKHTFADYRELLDSGLVQAVSVCVPTSLHSQIVVDAAENGVHVLCEKPLATNLDEANTMLEAVSKNGVKFSVDFNLRFLPSHRKVRDYIRQGRIGKPIFARAQLITTGPYAMNLDAYAYETQKRVGCLFDSGAHVADLMLWMFGKPSEVSAYFSTHMNGIDVDDTALTLIRFDSGLLGEIFVAWARIFNYSAMEESRLIEIFGTKGNLESEIFGPSFQFYSVDSIFCKLEGKIKVTPKKFDPEIPLEALNWSYKQEINDFLESIAYDRAPSVSGEEAKESLRVILAAYESYRKKSVISLG